MRKPRSLQISGFVVLGITAVVILIWGGVNIAGFVNSIEDFRTVNLPDHGVLHLKKDHYVVYYESRDDDTVPASGAGLNFSVQYRGAGYALAALPVKEYESELTYNWGDNHGRAVATFDVPSTGNYLITASDSSPIGSTSITIGPSIAALTKHYLVRGVIGALAILFVVGGAGVALLALYDKREEEAEETGISGPSENS